MLGMTGLFDIAEAGRAVEVSSNGGSLRGKSIVPGKPWMSRVCTPSSWSPIPLKSGGGVCGLVDETRLLGVRLERRKAGARVFR